MAPPSDAGPPAEAGGVKNELPPTWFQSSPCREKRPQFDRVRLSIDPSRIRIEA